MEHLYFIVEKVLFIIILLGTGILAKRMRWLTDQGERDVTALLMDFIWPSMVFASVTTSLTRADILSDIWLPLLCVFMHLSGLGIGLLICRLAGYGGDTKRIFLFHASINNFTVMVLPFAQSLFPEKGVALLAVANLGSMLALWTIGVFILVGNPGWRQTVRNICSPGLIATLAAIVCVLTGVNNYIPGLFIDVLQLIGQPMLLIGLMMAGVQIYKRGRGALKFDGWNVLVGLVRNIIVPAAMLGVALLLRGYIRDEALAMFMLISIAPASVNSTILAVRYHSDAGLAAEGVLFTHLLAIVTMVGFVALIEMFFMAPGV